MNEDLELVGYCGLCCSECDVFVAYVSGDRDMQEDVASSIARQFGAELDPDDIVCLGCRGPEEAHFGAACRIMRCAKERGHKLCSDCDEFDTCEELARFHATPIGKQGRANLLRIREIGIERWLEERS